MGRLTLTATQGGADAFVAGEIATGLTGQTTTAYQVRELIVELPTGASQSDIEVALSRRTKTSMPNVTDNDVMWKMFRDHLVVTSGGLINERIVYYTPTRDLFIVEDPIFWLVDTTGTSAANTVVGELFYDVVSISAIDRLTLLTQSLSDT